MCVRVLKVGELESKSQYLYVNSLLPCLFLSHSLACSDMVCASASVRTMSEDIKKALSYSHVAAFECHQVALEVIGDPFPHLLLSLHSSLSSCPSTLPCPLSVPSLISMPRSPHLTLRSHPPFLTLSKAPHSSLCLALHCRWMRRL